MNIVVCIKEVPDWEAPAERFTVVPDGSRVVTDASVKPLMSLFDEHAVEAGLQIVEAVGGSVTAISLGEPSALEILKRALRMGVNEAVLISDPTLKGTDSFGTATVLAAAIKKLGGADLVLCGRQAADWDAGQVGAGIAQALGVPCVSFVQKITPQNGNVRTERQVEDGQEVVEVALPAVLTVTNEINTPRLTSVAGIMAALKKKVPTWTASDLGLSGAVARRLNLVKLFQPKRDLICKIVEGETPAEAGEKLALALRAEKII